MSNGGLWDEEALPIGASLCYAQTRHTGRTRGVRRAFCWKMPDLAPVNVTGSSPLIRHWTLSHRSRADSCHWPPVKDHKDYDYGWRARYTTPSGALLHTPVPVQKYKVLGVQSFSRRLLVS